MTRHRRPRPRTDIPDWRDPAMPVLRKYLMPNGTKREVVDEDYERRYREHLLNTGEFPDHHDDPTYNLRRKRT